MSDVSAQIELASPGAVVAGFEHVGELTVEVQRERIVEACRALRDGPSLACASAAFIPTPMAPHRL